MFTGGFLAAAHTGMAGLVQAGYLTSSVLCIGPSFACSHYDRTFHSELELPISVIIRPSFSDHCTARQRARNSRCRLRHPCFTRGSRLPTRGACAICRCRRYWRNSRSDHRTPYYGNRTPANGGGIALSRRTCSRSHKYRQCDWRCS